MLQVNHLLPILDKHLLTLLRSLDAADWQRQTLAPRWTVHDVAVHLLDGNIRSLSMLRDGYFGEKAENVNSYRDLVDFLNQLNADWVKAFKRVSPALVIELLESTGKQYCDYLSTLDPSDDAVFSVAWAGEEKSKNWFHIAREYTEKWHHQQQIRYAVGADDRLLQADLYQPYLATSMHALPHHYQTVAAPPKSYICVRTTGTVTQTWYLLRSEDHWLLSEEAPDTNPISTIVIPANIAWRLFTKGIDRAEAQNFIQFDGDLVLGYHILSALAVMA